MTAKPFVMQPTVTFTQCSLNMFGKTYMKYIILFMVIIR